MMVVHEKTFENHWSRNLKWCEGSSHIIITLDIWTQLLLPAKDLPLSVAVSIFLFLSSGAAWPSDWYWAFRLYLIFKVRWTFLPLKIKSQGFPETSDTSQAITQRNMLEVWRFQLYHCDNLQTLILLFFRTEGLCVVLWLGMCVGNSKLEYSLYRKLNISHFP